MELEPGSEMTTLVRDTMITRWCAEGPEERAIKKSGRTRGGLLSSGDVGGEAREAVGVERDSFGAGKERVQFVGVESRDEDGGDKEAAGARGERVARARRTAPAEEARAAPEEADEQREQPERGEQVECGVVSRLSAEALIGAV